MGEIQGKKQIVVVLVLIHPQTLRLFEFILTDSNVS